MPSHPSRVCPVLLFSQLASPHPPIAAPSCIGLVWSSSALCPRQLFFLQRSGINRKELCMSLTRNPEDGWSQGQVSGSGMTSRALALPVFLPHDP